MRTTLSLFFLLITTASVSSQSFNGGVQTALVVSQIAGDGMSGFNKAGVQGGFYVNYMIKSNLSLQMELAYIQKGSARAEKVETGESQYLRRLNYVEWPLIVQYHLHPLLLEAGLSVDFLTASFEEINYQISDASQIWRKVNANTVFGIRYKLGANWQLILRSVNSINSIRKNSVPLNVRRYSRNYGEFNDALLFGVAYQF